jgi:carbon storage regulator
VLVLTRRAGESIVIGDEVRVVVLEVRGDTVRLGIDAPRSVQVHRAEVYAEVQAANAAAASSVEDLDAVADRLQRLARPVTPRRGDRPSRSTRPARPTPSAEPSNSTPAVPAPPTVPSPPSPAVIMHEMADHALGESTRSVPVAPEATVAQEHPKPGPPPPRTM